MSKEAPRMFNDKIARQSIEQMKGLGVQFAPGLAGQQVESIESALGAKLPPELDLFLRQAVPLSLKGDNSFPDWRRDPVEVVAESRRQI